MLKVVTKKKEWDHVVDSFDKSDFYHSYDYHQACLKEKEAAKLLVYKASGATIALPLLVRPINGSGYFDAASVYGYAGPLVSQLNEDFNFVEWKTRMLSYFTENKIVSVFSSINPFVEHQMELLSIFGEIEKLGDIVFFDLERPQTHFKDYSKTTKRYIKRNENLFDIREGKSEEDARKFIKIYYRSMDRIQADSQYYFNLEYFMDLLNSKSCDAYFVFATKDNGKEISAAFIVRTNQIIQYHLSGTLDKYRHLSPVRTIIDHVRKKGIAENSKFFNLGGGVGSKNDTLFEFKASFSKNRTPFKVWKFIANSEVYHQLCREYPPIQDLDKPNYFPKYRSSLNKS
ncbi:GNAT family N-acetyltransferase [Flagellimonas aequoris]|uniref:Peptidoglycan bridge formation glycyltransferase FemA/FemB family protein n=1 Tax=Flagellimonas aequoris TaxID=2306997 RepID=A0A418NDH5_9FLAO|nr:GNAT family N-acetyltransferase [Allomuricauda aequoris]RIV74400.1 peptidoglycan bridge formation glycyltransferase FemA/FemB family protein [Allomuricauda aequoris]TXK08522.1 peptidoglycan bridge formation glycyltransferase FemA/FemB family protein [Allomuricauda aequoris]